MTTKTTTKKSTAKTTSTKAVSTAALEKRVQTLEDELAKIKDVLNLKI